jgi:E-phenylitaconyl-CoA hydratase
VSGVDYRRSGPVAVVTLNRPAQANSLTRDMIERILPEVWTEVGCDPQVRVALLTAAGGPFFCAGMDLTDADLTAASAGDGTLPTVRATARQNGVFKPVIAAVDGRCLGGGLMFVADADLVIGSEQAEFGNPATSIGQVATVAGVVLAKRGHLDAALRMVLLGRHATIGAVEAYRLGLLSELVPAGRLLDRAMELAGLVASNSPMAVQASLRDLWSALDLPAAEAVSQALASTDRWRHHPDSVEGAAAHREHRPPRWTDLP